MIPAAIPPIAPGISLGELFGPLASLAVLGAMVALAILVALLAGASWVTARRRLRRRQAGGAARRPVGASHVRSAA
jgi:hypothetical protein